jgi:RNA polymerase sigma-70 factor (ECF subfamily)
LIVPEREPLFTTTHWSVVLSARDEADGSALESLCRDYWRPLYVLARRFGRAQHDAEDLVQGFFAKLLAKDWLHAAEPDRGRFRTFLSVAFRRHMSDEHDHATRKKRGGGAIMIPLDVAEAEAFYNGDLATVESVEHAFDKAWILGVISSAQSRLRDECAAAGKSALAEAVDSGRPYAEIAEELGLTVSAVTSAAFRFRRRCEELIRTEIVRTVASPDEADSEIAHLLSVLRR